ncbi:MAG: SWIM zinc finger family protein [Actinomycetes bacterium]
MSRGSRRGSSQFFAPSKPRPVEGGLKARSKRGAIGRTWWSERFIAVLDEIGVSGRLQRGRAYARRGQVIDLHVDAGSVTARVQGSRPAPYRVRIGITAYGKAEWAAVERELAGNAWYLAKLLAGEMPEDIEEAFSGVGLSLFPAGGSDLVMDCSCPDWEVPCKHVAATLYLLAESFDDDPFAILAWRGREREDLLANLQAARTDAPRGVDPEGSGAPLEDCIDSYFSLQAELPRRPLGHGRGNDLLAQLPAVEVGVRGTGIVDLLRPLYEELARPQG